MLVRILSYGGALLGLRYLPVRLSPRCCGHRKEGLGCCLLRMSPVRCGGCGPLAFQTIGDHYLPEREKVTTVRKYFVAPRYCVPSPLRVDQERLVSIATLLHNISGRVIDLYRQTGIFTYGAIFLHVVLDCVYHSYLVIAFKKQKGAQNV